MIDLTAPIEPGMSAAGIRIGDDIRAFLVRAGSCVAEMSEESFTYDYGPVRLWSVSHVICQIGVREGYRGTLCDKVMIGSAIAEVERFFHCEVAEDDEDNLVVPVLSGWCFETEPWSGDHTVKSNKHARITAIYVFDDNC